MACRLPSFLPPQTGRIANTQADFAAAVLGAHALHVCMFACMMRDLLIEWCRAAAPCRILCAHTHACLMMRTFPCRRLDPAPLPDAEDVVADADWGVSSRRGPGGSRGGHGRARAGEPPPAAADLPAHRPGLLLLTLCRGSLISCAQVCKCDGEGRAVDMSEGEAKIACAYLAHLLTHQGGAARGASSLR